MDKKLEYISRQFSRAENKRLEHYVVTRIWHMLNDLSIKFVTQQHITRPQGRALADMFFPQVKMWIEIYEDFHKNQIEWDKCREADIINATGFQMETIYITKKNKPLSIEKINQEISRIIKKIKEKKKEASDFVPWDLESEQNPKTFIERGYLDVDDDVAFKREVDAANCFGCNFKGLQLGSVKHPKEDDTLIWFPKLYKNNQCANSISDDETIINEIMVKQDRIEKHIDKIMENGPFKRIVFARVKSPLGDIMYRFKGLYELDKKSSDYRSGLAWRQISKRVSTYP